jgi:Flp pilus assembly protein TadB
MAFARIASGLRLRGFLSGSLEAQEAWQALKTDGPCQPRQHPCPRKSLWKTQPGMARGGHLHHFLGDQVALVGSVVAMARQPILIALIFGVLAALLFLGWQSWLSGSLRTRRRLMEARHVPHPSSRSRS